MPRPFSQEKRQEWKDKIQNQQASGLSISKWCCDQQVNVHAFYYWKDHLCPKVPLFRASFTESIGANGDIILYNPSTNSFAISNAEGLPRTLYKPSLNRHPYSTNLEYFNAQK